jgi:NTP pyrophosphatase (non-canonical NTP hydrolase)
MTPERIKEIELWLTMNEYHASDENERGIVSDMKRLVGQTFQSRVQPWMTACFGEEISSDKVERNHRFLEEALELVQSCGCSKDEAIQLVEYVYGRDRGEMEQEVGGVMVTLAAHCLAHGADMHQCGETELARIWTKVEKIRAKQAAKPKNSPLPQ